MAEYTVTCLTLTMLPTNPTGIFHPEAHGFIEGKRRTTRVRVALDNAASAVTYPAGGIALPSWNATGPAANGNGISYGMRRNLSYLIPVAEAQPTVSRAEDVLWKYSSSGGGGAGSLRAYQQRGVSGQANEIVTMFKEVATTWSATLMTDKTPSWEFIAVGW